MASAATVGGAGITKIAAKANSIRLAQTGALLNTSADYADAITMLDTGRALATNWNDMSNAQKAQGLLTVAFWGGLTGVSARASGGSVTDVFNPRIQMQQAMAGVGATAKLDNTLGTGQVRIKHEGDGGGLFGNREFEVVFGPGTSPVSYTHLTLPTILLV